MAKHGPKIGNEGVESVTKNEGKNQGSRDIDNSLEQDCEMANPKLRSFHFDLGNSSVGPVGFCAVVRGQNPEDALERLKKVLPESVSVPLYEEDENVEYIEVYLNSDSITLADIDFEDEEDAVQCSTKMLRKGWIDPSITTPSVGESVTVLYGPEWNEAEYPAIFTHNPGTDADLPPLVFLDPTGGWAGPGLVYAWKPIKN